MQSQQKRVKWSRGETAEALEERTDTGITQASVELMENCIPDIYGNISRRPALKLIDGIKESCDSFYCGSADPKVQFIPFYITEDDFILFSVPTTQSTGIRFIRIKNGVDVASQEISGVNIVPYSGVYTDGVWISKPISYAQQNNFMIIATESRIYKLTITLSGDSFTPTFEYFNFSGGWYAPNGTQIKQVNTSVIPGLAISGHFYYYVYTDASGTTNMYSNTSTGISGQANKELLEQEIPVGSIVKMPNIGCYFRVEGYYNEADNLYFSSITFSALQVHNDRHVAPGVSGAVCVAVTGFGLYAYLEYWLNDTLQQEVQVPVQTPIYVKSTVSSTGYSTNMTYPDNYLQKWGTWQNADMSDQTVRMFGALLAPVVDENASDDTVAVEYGYESLTPDSNVLLNTPLFPHPKQLCFCEQRLWAGGWAFSLEQECALVIGSQIARYNDFKNDFNQENEPIELDILTQYKEKVVHLLDYNGLKIFTDSFEYIYSGGGVVKQSGNGSLAECKPIVFEALCLYCDATGNQIRAMQYEFQSNIFNSSCINQVAPHDLINFPKTLAGWEDKFNSTGKYLFVINTNTTESPVLAVCNFVPSNQANIWSRWNFPKIYSSPNLESPRWFDFVYDIVPTKKYPIFILKTNNFREGGLLPSEIETASGLVPAVLNFDAISDLETNIDDNNRVIIGYHESLDATKPNDTLTLINTEVAVYSDGVFQFTTTTDNFGTITADLSGLTNITVGLPINSKIVSHPIDVGGKTKSVKKRIGKVQMSVHDTDAGAISINGKTGYMNPRNDHICFYGVSGMKDEVKYTITNKNGAMFHLESLLMNIEYGTLDS